MLELDAINAGSGRAQVLRDLSLKVESGEILCLLGRNGAGKTTTMQAIMGLLPLLSGRVILDGKEVSRLPAHEVPRAGLGYIPQGRRLFAGLTVAQNLEIGLRVRGSGKQTDLLFSTNVGDYIMADDAHPLSMQGERPDLLVRDGLSARLTRSVFYRLVDFGVEEDGALYVYSQGARFNLGALH